MTAKVFISCGTRPGRERESANKIKNLIESLGFKTYFSINIQSLDDVMSIIDNLKQSDYYVFIDFKRKTYLRKKKNQIPISVYTHQELAIARDIGFDDPILICENGINVEGFLKYILSNPLYFNTESELLALIENDIKNKKWDKFYKRNLIPKLSTPLSASVNYRDHSWENGSQQEVWYLFIENKRKNQMARNVQAILDHIILPNGQSISPDAAPLKWAGFSGYSATIFPEREAHFDAFCVIKNVGIYLHSLADVIPRQSIINSYGNYKFEYHIAADNFPLTKVILNVDYNNGNIAVNL